MNTVVAILAVMFTASWGFKRNAGKSLIPTQFANFHAAPAIKGIPLAMLQESSGDNRSSFTWLKKAGVVGGKCPQPTDGEFYSRTRQDFIELRSKAAAIIARYQEQQDQLKNQLNQDLATIQEQLELLQRDVSEEMETIAPKLQDLIHQSWRNKGS